MKPSFDSPTQPSYWDALDTLHDVECDETWDLVFALRKEGDQRTLEHALAWCKDADPFRRSIGVSVLAQLGEDGKGYPDESNAMIHSMIQTEQDHEVITSLISAVSFRELHACVGWLLAMGQQSSEDIRWRVAWALPIRNPHDSRIDPQQIETLMQLAADPEPHVREWATFALSMTDEDTPSLRERLLERMNDTDFNTRTEAARGLAKRKEPRGLKLLFDDLKSDRVGELHVEAAEMYADPSLIPALVALRRWWDIDPELLERAIQACSLRVGVVGAAPPGRENSQTT
jgi:HEAT repeat protein